MNKEEEGEEEEEYIIVNEQESQINRLNRPMTKEEKKLVENQRFIGVIEDMGVSVHRIKDSGLTRIEILGIQFNQKKLYTSTYLCLEDKHVDKLISLLQKSKQEE